MSSNNNKPQITFNLSNDSKKGQSNQFNVPIQSNNTPLYGTPSSNINSFSNSSPFVQQQAPINYQQPVFQYQQAPQQYNQLPPQQTQQIYQPSLLMNQAPIQMNQIPQESYQIPAQTYGGNQMYVQNSFGGPQTNSLKLLNNREQDKNKQVVAVIVTISNNGSYDHLFATVEQKSEEGTRVLVYEASSTYIQNLIKAFEGNPQDQVSKQMMTHIGKVHPDCVVFNWECCAFYGSKNFPQGKDNVFKFLKIILDKGHMAMFSDFSLKALIQDWKQDVLGPNPFVSINQTSTPIDMRFKAGDLKECPSAQLQIVGQMVQGGHCNINVLGGTIVYSVDQNKLNHEFYKLKVLSVCTNQVPPQQNYQCSIGEFMGSACHVLLTYPSGGMILTSMGHWIELMKIDTSEKKLFQVAEKNFGKQYAAQMQMEYASLDVSKQQAWVSQNAVQFVQNQAPCSNMSKKMKSFS